MIYGTDEVLRQANLKQQTNPSGFLYGTDAATNVGRAAPAPRPNNSLWLEERTWVQSDAVESCVSNWSTDGYVNHYFSEKDAVKNQKLALTQGKIMKCWIVNPFIPNISMYVLFTILHIFLILLVERLSLKSIYWRHFIFGDYFLYSADLIY